MKSHDVALSSSDTVADAISVDEHAAAELFAVVDLLEEQPPLRRSLSDPSATVTDRQALARRLLEGRVSPPALHVIAEITGQAWPSGETLVAAIERQGIRGLLRTAREAGELERVQEELNQFAGTIDGSPELADALRNRGRSLADRRALIARLLSGKVTGITMALANRAAAARNRTVVLTLGHHLELAAELAQERIARVVVARPLDAARTQRLRSALEAQVGGRVFLQFEVDPAVLGGMSVTLGSDVFESTIAARLDDVRRQLN
ncbi:F0F1 ATP synthase subunit delta [Arachnia propionica]|uniref:ATP synthase subunit delta n=1 Tax=Arachnia propionica TaxID=1750 RepID=A0A3P1TC95_9ACTN|nr:F0F1 ATP synthase subunit delta [Arachnia propionica]MDO5082579.1 F0F1 ATP synthase subunit delta [Arachnia propionica]RRD07072.1 F0F1 ATP synthase subunit delta [Arachnia propionica]